MMNLMELLKKRSKKIEETYDLLFELENGLVGADVEYQGKEAIIMQVDWEDKSVLLNYDDVNMEWIAFD